MNPPLVKGKGKQSFYFQLKQGITGFGIFSIDPLTDKKCAGVEGELVSYYAGSYLYHNADYLNKSGFGEYTGAEDKFNRIVVLVQYYHENTTTGATGDSVTDTKNFTTKKAMVTLLTPDSKAIPVGAKLQCCSKAVSAVGVKVDFTVSADSVSNINLVLKSGVTEKSITFVRTTALFNVNLCDKAEVSTVTQSFNPTGNWSFKSSNNFYLSGIIEIKKIPGIS
jgi:hypothetical protein